MLSSKSMQELLSNLKGRISKILNMSRSLDENEVFALTGIFMTIDDIILWNKKLTKNKISRFKKVIKEHYAIISSIQKDYVRKHINPLIERLIEKDWE